MFCNIVNIVNTVNIIYKVYIIVLWFFVKKAIKKATKTIRISKSLHGKLSELGSYCDSMDKIICRLFDEHIELKKLKSKQNYQKYKCKKR